MARPAKKRGRGRPRKLSIDERIKKALAEAHALKEIGNRQSALADELRELSEELNRLDEGRISGDDLEQAADYADGNNGSDLEDNMNSVICYLEGKHGC